MQLTVYDQQDNAISFYVTSQPGENMETVCALVQNLPLDDGKGSFSYRDSHDNEGHGTISLTDGAIGLELRQETAPNDDLPLPRGALSMPLAISKEGSAHRKRHLYDAGGRRTLAGYL